jgi:integrase
MAYTDGEGKRHFKSTGTPDKDEAQTFLDATAKAIGLRKKGHLTQQRARSIIETVVAEVMESQGDSLKRNPTNEFLSSWLSEMERQITPSTFNSYKAITSRFIAFLGASATESIATVEIGTIRGYRDQLVKDLSTGTVNNHLKMLRLAFESAAQQDLIDRNPAKLVKNLARNDKQERDPFTPAQLKTLLEVVTGDWRTAVYIGAYTGLRLGDVAGLKWNQCDLVRMEVYKKTKKTGKIVIIPIAAPLAKLLEELPTPAQQDSPICPGLSGKKSSRLSSMFNSLLIKAGLIERRDYRIKKTDTERRIYTGLSFHCLRHNATSMLKNNGVSDAVARDIIGHSSEAVSRNYTHIDSETKKKAYIGLPDLSNL